MQKAEREFALSLLALSQNIKRAMDVHENLAQSMQRPAELMMGSFDAIKVREAALVLLFCNIVECKLCGVIYCNEVFTKGIRSESVMGILLL